MREKKDGGKHPGVYQNFKLNCCSLARGYAWISKMQGIDNLQHHLGKAKTWGPAGLFGVEPNLSLHSPLQSHESYKRHLIQVLQTGNHCTLQRVPKHCSETHRIKLVNFIPHRCNNASNDTDELNQRSWNAARMAAKQHIALLSSLTGR